MNESFSDELHINERKEMMFSGEDSVFSDNLPVTVMADYYWSISCNSLLRLIFHLFISPLSSNLRE